MTELISFTIKAIVSLVLVVSLIACVGADFSGSGATKIELQLEGLNLSWIAPTENTDGSVLSDINGYKIYYGTSPDAMDKSIAFNIDDMEALSIDNFVLIGGLTHYFSITTVNSNNIQSKYSNTIYRVVPN